MVTPLGYVARRENILGSERKFEIAMDFMERHFLTLNAHLDKILNNIIRSKLRISVVRPINVLCERTLFASV